MSNERTYPGAAVSTEGVLYVAGGEGQSGMEMYDANVKRWERCAEMHTGERYLFDLLSLHVPHHQVNRLYSAAKK